MHGNGEEIKGCVKISSDFKKRARCTCSRRHALEQINYFYGVCTEAATDEIRIKNDETWAQGLCELIACQAKCDQTNIDRQTGRTRQERMG